MRLLIALLLCAGCSSTAVQSPPPMPEPPQVATPAPSQQAPSPAEPVPTPPPAPEPEATSLLGKPLISMPAAADVQKKREEELEQARRDYEANPDNADAIIWLGRRTAYLGRYRDAIAIYTEGIRKHPDDARFYRHRGHRFITVRQFQDAVTDLEYAAKLVRGKRDQIEPDGQPNVRNIPLTSLNSNIYYHLGLAYYLLGDFEKALGAYQRCARLSNNPDRVVSTSHWQYMTLRRLGRVKEAEKVLEPISASMDVIENVSYHKLVLMYGGDIAPEELARQDADTTEGATILHGIGNWYFYNGQPEKAFPIWQRIVDGSQWSAFGYIAAEAEMAGRGKR